MRRDKGQSQTRHITRSLSNGWPSYPGGSDIRQHYYRSSQSEAMESYFPLADLEEALNGPQVQAVVLELCFLAITEPKPHEPDDPPVRARLPADDVQSEAAEHRGSATCRPRRAAWPRSAWAAFAVPVGGGFRGETQWLRNDAEKMLADFRAEAAAELATVRTDLRARAERAEHEAEAYRVEVAQVTS
jgi:hypothetical protein